MLLIHIKVNILLINVETFSNLVVRIYDNEIVKRGFESRL